MYLSIAAAAPQTTLDRLRQIPTEFWVKAGLGVLGLVAAVILLRKLAKVNKLVLTIVVLLVVMFFGFTWVYDRSEPAWATPVVQWLAGFFPSKGKAERRPE